MLKRTAFLAILATAFIAGKCKEDPPKTTPDPDKQPTACFTQDKTLIDAEIEEVRVDASCSKDAVSYNWDFGDAYKTTGVTATRKYKAPGNYKITLTTTNGSKTDTVSRMVRVGSRVFGTITLSGYELMRPAAAGGGAWDDDGSNPDIFITFGPSTTGPNFGLSTDTIQNASGQPITLNVLPASQIKWNATKYTFKVWDADPESQSGQKQEPMTTFTYDFLAKPIPPFILEGSSAPGYMAEMKYTLK